MSPSRIGIKALGLSALCALMTMLMAIGGSTAQAEVGAYWLVSGKKISETLLPTIVMAVENNDLALLFKLSNRNIHILCTAAALEETHVVEPNGGLLGKIKFSGCKFIELNLSGVPSEVKDCNPVGGNILSLKFKGLITLHESQGRITLTSFTGTSLFDIFLGIDCPYGENAIIGGKLVLKDCQNAFLTDQVTHLFEEDKVLTKLWANSETNPATLDGSFNMSLTGAHAGMTWAGHPA
jgi:hypothetical protein